jgi:hypothetical protein
MNAPLTQRLLVLPLACAAFFAVACETPPPEEGADRLFATATASTLIQGAQTTIAVRGILANGKPADGSVTATIAKVNDADIAAIASAGDALTEPTAVLTLDDTGRGTFDFQCLGVGAAVVSFAGESGDASATINCIEPEVPRTIAIDTTDCLTFLLADGSSTCQVDVTLRDASNNAPVPGINLTVRVDATVTANGPGNDRVLKANRADGVTSTLAGVVTDAVGRASFFVQSPAFGLEQTISFTVADDARNSGSADVVVLPFENKSSVALSAEASTISSATSTNVTVTGLDVNTAPAAGKLATITVSGGLTVTAAGCLADNAGVLEATLDVAGQCTFAVTAPTTDVELTANVSASFLALDGRGELPKTADLALRITPVGVTVANPVTDRTLIFADADPATSTTTMTVTRDGDAFDDVTVTATVAAESRGVIKLVSQRVGTAGNAQPVADEDTVVIVSPTDGVVAFAVTADNRVSRGSGRLIISVIGADGAVIEAGAVINITVDRQPLLSSLVFGAFAPGSRIGVPGGALPSSTGLSFRLLDEENNPVANVPVRFVAQSSVPGVAVVPFDTSDASGTVNTVVTAGNVAGPITVVAIVDSPALSAVAPPVVVLGGLPNSAYSSLLCDKTAVQDPFSAACTVSLADKFTNVVETALDVQFRAEGGNITPAATAGGGIASASFAFSQPGPGSADVRAWSYSPLRNAPAVVRAAFPGCFDRTTRTPCDLLAMCSPAENDPNRATFEAFCPLPPAVGAASLCSADISGTTRQALIDEANNAAAWELELFFPGLNPLVAIDVTAQFAAYSDEHRLCGMPVSCLIGDLDGLGLDSTDNCPVNPGCLDFNGETECPQNGLLDILAAVRGEEGFDDDNGNGVRDANESFVDFPEPFLDKNSSCSFDSLNNNGALTAGQKIQLSDLFIDSDAGDGLFGFNQGGQRTETNGAFDSDTEIFVKTSIVLLGQARLQVGEFTDAANCGDDGATAVVCTQQANPAAPSLPDHFSTCTETAGGGLALLENCRPVADEFREGETVRLGFRWTDANGNCPTDDFSGTPAVTVSEGPVIVSADDNPYSPGECGAVPGGIGSSNPERPWCEEHPSMGAPIRFMNVTVDCRGETGDVPVKITFDLGETSRFFEFTVGCPVCGDRKIEGAEQCDNGPGNAPAPNATCDAACNIVAP